VLALAALALPLRGQAQPQSANLPAAEGGPGFVPISKLFPGGGTEPPLDPRAKLYENNPQMIAEGKRLFTWLNCVGCHFNGGGGMGPALMDKQWRYGDRIDQIYSSIAHGRPNGMPTWGGIVPDAQIWQLAAYVKSLSIPTTAQMTGGQPQPPPPPAAPSPLPQSAPPGGSPR
jgi:cytochrome c oxidase cbb3-type subunit 3